MCIIQFSSQQSDCHNTHISEELAVKVRSKHRAHIIPFYLHCSPTRWIALLHSFFSEELRQRGLSNLPKVPILVSDGAPVPSQAVWPQSLPSCLIMILCIMLWWSHDFNSPLCLYNYNPSYRTRWRVPEVLADAWILPNFQHQSSFFLFLHSHPLENRFSVGEWRQSMPRSALAASPAVPEACGEGSGWGGASERPNILSRKLKRAPAKGMSNLYSSLLPPPEGQRGQSVCLMRCFLSSRDSAEGARCRM